MTDNLKQAELYTWRALQESSNIATQEGISRYYLLAAAQQLVIAAQSDMHPTYLADKVSSALMLLQGAFSADQQLPIAITLTVEGGVVQIPISVTARGANLRCNVQVIDLDVEEESGGLL